MNPRIHPAFMTSRKGPETIHQVGEHVEKQSDCNDPGPAKEKQYNIYTDGYPGVQRMETDAAAVRIEKRGCSEMVQVDQHREHQDQPGHLPPVAKKNKCNEQRENQVKGIMNDRLHHKVRLLETRVRSGFASPQDHHSRV